ncbi:MAG TPA: glycine betaine ABC transporter substrate-binding protein [Stellaceae bacterium]|nr:glycine betaine ABC transporter substrate-binding protein [Stellaceae bacterium]
MGLHRAVVAGAFLALALLVADRPAAQEAVRVASKLDSESSLLGAMILLLLEADGIKTVDKLQLGPTNILRHAILAGEIDIYPEYTGNGALFYADDQDPAWKDARAGYDKVRSLDLTRHGLVWLAPAPADNSWVVAVPRAVAVANNLATMADFADWVRRGGAVVLAASAEFVESPAALPAFERRYDFSLPPSSLLVLAGGDTAVTLRAAAEGISGVNAAMAYATDGALAVLGLVALSDPRRAQIIYAPAPVVRAAVLERYPIIRDSLAPVFAALDTTSLRRLNARIAVDGEVASAVAADYLRSRGRLR